MDLVEIIQRFGLEHLGRYYSIYRGIVRENDDPLHLSRVKVYIPSIQRGLEIWALPKSVYGTFGAGIRGPIPKIGEVVYITFEMGDPLKPYWSYHGWARGEVPSEFGDNNTIGIVTPNGNKVLLSDDNGTLTIQVQNNINIKVVNDEGKITFNDGEVGVPESTKLVDRLNLIESAINNLQTIISVLKPSGPATGADGTSLLTALLGWQPNLSKTLSSDIESKEIFQKQ